MEASVFYCYLSQHHSVIIQFRLSLTTSALMWLHIHHSYMTASAFPITLHLQKRQLENNKQDAAKIYFHGRLGRVFCVAAMATSRSGVAMTPERYQTEVKGWFIVMVRDSAYLGNCAQGHHYREGWGTERNLHKCKFHGECSYVLIAHISLFSWGR